MKVGDYVRTNRGYIYKLGRYDEKEERWICYEDYDWFPVYESEVKISSLNIIDLIEIGDYVNGSMVVNKIDDKILITQLMLPYDLKEQNIKNVVTHEQFESMKYRIGE